MNFDFITTLISELILLLWLVLFNTIFIRFQTYYNWWILELKGWDPIKKKKLQGSGQWPGFPGSRDGTDDD